MRAVLPSGRGCEVENVDSEACCDKGDDARFASGSDAYEDYVGWLAWASWDAVQMLCNTASLSLCQV